MEIALIVICAISLITNIILLVCLLRKNGLFAVKSMRSSTETDEETVTEAEGIPEDILVAVLTAAAISVLETRENKRFRVVSFRPLTED